MARIRLIAAALFALLVFATAAIADDLVPGEAPQLSKEVLEKAKKATAVVMAWGDTYTGTAFCVHPSGLFLTSDLFGVEGPVRLLINAGEKTQKIVDAEIIMSSRVQGIYLLRVIEKGDYTALDLGSADDVIEQTTLYYLDFDIAPIDSQNPRAEQPVPPCIVRSATVRETGRSSGRIMSIRLEYSGGRGKGGGPLISSEGKVVGMTKGEGPIGGGGIKNALGVDALRDSMPNPIVVLSPPEKITADSLAKPLTLQAFLADFHQRDNSAATVGISLQPCGQPASDVQMKGDGGTYTAETVLVPEKGAASGFQAKVQFDGSEMTGTIEPVVLKSAGEEISLDKIAEIKGGATPTAILRDGKGERALDPGTKLSVKVGPHSTEVDLTKVARITIRQSAGPPPYIKYRLSVKKDNVEICYEEGAIAVDDVFDCPPPANADAAALEGSLTAACPAKIRSIVDAGNGAFLICHFPQIMRLGVFDVNKLAFVKFIPVDDLYVKYAGGRDKLIVYQAASKTLERWDLKSLTMEQSVPFGKHLEIMAMGSDTDNPLYLGVAAPDARQSGELLQMDVSKMELTGEETRFQLPGPLAPPARCSADGSVICYWGTGFMVTKNGQQGMFNAMPFVGGRTEHVLPGYDGDHVYYMHEIAYNNLKTIPESDTYGSRTPASFTAPDTQGTIIPSIQDDYFLVLCYTGSAVGSAVSANLHVVGEKRALGTIQELALDTECFSRDRTFPVCDRVWFLPRSKLIVTLPYGNRLLVARKFDPVAMDELSGIKTPVLLGTLPTYAYATEGEPFTYQFKVRSKAGGLRYNFETGPLGMTLSDDGRLDWPAPAVTPGERAHIIVIITDNSGEKLRCEFRLGIAMRPKPRE
jgi:hypothetical protein